MKSNYKNKEITKEVLESELSRQYEKIVFGYSCTMKSHFWKFGNQMSGSGNHLCEFTRVMLYLDHIPHAWTCHAQHQCL